MASTCREKEWSGSGPDISTDVRGMVWYFLVLLIAPHTGPSRIPTENTVENHFTNQSIPQKLDYGQTEKQAKQTIETNITVL